MKVHLLAIVKLHKVDLDFEFVHHISQGDQVDVLLGFWNVCCVFKDAPPDHLLNQVVRLDVLQAFFLLFCKALRWCTSGLLQNMVLQRFKPEEILLEASGEV